MRVFKNKKVPAVLRNLIVAEAIAYGIFMLSALSADWGELYMGLKIADYLRFEVVEFTLLGIAQLGLIFLVFTKSLPEKKSTSDLIKSGEHEKLEFKSSLRWDIKRSQVNKELEKVAMKTIAAFLNSDGGQLLLGIDDRGGVVGLETDLASLPKADVDGFENHFNNLFNKMIGPEFRRLVKLDFNNIDGKIVCLAYVERSHKPVFLRADNCEDFYIRTGNVTTPLRVSEAASYISSKRFFK